MTLSNPWGRTWEGSKLNSTIKKGRGKKREPKETELKRRKVRKLHMTKIETKNSEREI